MLNKYSNLIDIQIDLVQILVELQSFSRAEGVAGRGSSAIFPIITHRHVKDMGSFLIGSRRNQVELKNLFLAIL